MVPLDETSAKSRPNLPRCPFSAAEGAWPGTSGRFSVVARMFDGRVRLVYLDVC